jgi:YHS domain-containing protein
MARDPVCEMDVEDEASAPTSEYEGQTYYFCCDACKEEFDRSPEEYVDREP